MTITMPIYSILAPVCPVSGDHISRPCCVGRVFVSCSNPVILLSLLFEACALGYATDSIIGFTYWSSGVLSYPNIAKTTW